MERLSRPDAAAARVPVAQSRPATVAETPEHAAAPEETGGRLDGLRRFFGFKRSQERMNDEGLAHQKATDQERGPRTGE